MRYIDDVFFIWHHDEKSLKDFLKFCDNYSTRKKMKSNIKFETNSSTDSVNFLDVKVEITGNTIKTSLYTKPTDAHLYLNAKSSHPLHVVRNIPKGQFIRVRRICSADADFDYHAKQMKKYFLLRGYTEKQLQQAIDIVRKIPRNELLREKQCAVDFCMYLALKQLPSILKENFRILNNDPKLQSIFKEEPTVAFRRKKNLKNILCKNDVRTNEHKNTEGKYKGCQLCVIMSDRTMITNKNNGATVKTKPGGTVNLLVWYMQSIARSATKSMLDKPGNQ